MDSFHHPFQQYRLNSDAETQPPDRICTPPPENTATRDGETPTGGLEGFPDA